MYPNRFDQFHKRQQKKEQEEKMTAYRYYDEKKGEFVTVGDDNSTVNALYTPLNVNGYTTQNQTNIDIVNENKKLEERVLRALDYYDATRDHDPYWLEIARAQIQQGFMAMNRAIFKPTRVKLD